MRVSVDERRRGSIKPQLFLRKGYSFRVQQPTVTESVSVFVQTNFTSPSFDLGLYHCATQLFMEEIEALLLEMAMRICTMSFL